MDGVELRFYDIPTDAKSDGDAEFSLGKDGRWMRRKKGWRTIKKFPNEHTALLLPRFSLCGGAPAATETCLALYIPPKSLLLRKLLAGGGDALLLRPITSNLIRSLTTNYQFMATILTGADTHFVCFVLR